MMGTKQRHFAPLIYVSLEEQHIRASVPLSDFDQRTDFFGQRDFRYIAERDVYMCPNEAELHLLPSGCTDQYLQYRESHFLTGT
jgi:hypothetical protein